MSAAAAGGSTREVAAHARRLVLNEIARRGGTAREVRVGLRTEIHLTGPGGSRRLRVVSRRRGDWQSSIREGDTKGEPDRFWVFVDLMTTPADFHIGPEDEVVHGIRTRHEEYLRRNGGRRVQTTPRSTARSDSATSTGSPGGGTCSASAADDRAWPALVLQVSALPLRRTTSLCWAA